ncbi:hypothetical protein [Actinoplanes sp. NPDC051851]|uniref:hypothetical protein n=1 Tax=Actinoplanes sp. NPDC051851 TaxID=3154753 RepID=UPI00342B1025
MSAISSATTGSSAALGDLLCLLVICAIVAVIVRGTRSANRKRDARAAAAWQTLVLAAHHRPGTHICYVVHVYQSARRGTKAVIAWADTGARQDAWFWYFWPAAGSALLVIGAVGFGPHNRDPAVFFVDSGGVLALAPPGAQAAWHRLQAAGHH